jgi:DNA polymerase-3 subunit delta
MVALKTAEIERFMARPDPARPVVLVYGPDAGLVHERTEALINASVDDPADPFALARLEGDALADEPARLAEEANTVPLFGGRRAVWVRAGSRNIANAVEAVIAAPSPDCRVVIEAGDLKRSSPLRVVCERAKNAVAVPCYVDAERDLARLIDTEVKEAGLTIDAEARAALVSLLGGDRQASRSELNKLILFARDKGRIDLDDVVAVVADASALALDGLIDAAFGGRTRDVETQFAKARMAGTAGGTIVSTALRHVTQMHKVRTVLDGGSDQDTAMKGFAPPIHFRRKVDVEGALKSWTTPRLERVMNQLADGVLQTRKTPALAETVAHRALLSIAVAARRRS